MTQWCIDKVNALSFGQQALQSGLPVLVVVWRDGMDQRLFEMLEDWAPQVRSRLRVFGLDAGCSPGLAERFGLPSAPGLALFKGGALCYQFLGNASQQELNEVLALAGAHDTTREDTNTADARGTTPPGAANRR